MKGIYMNKGFTLAEVLITLGIIGVVAAMTMPTLIQDQQKRSLEVATKKFYSTISQAVRKYMADEGVDDLRITPLSSNNYDDVESPDAVESLRNFAINYLKVVKECDNDQNACFAEKYSAFNGGETLLDFLVIATSSVSFILSDGMSVHLEYGGFDSPINVYVDVNGKKGPNRVGYDLWSMSIFYDGTIDEGDLFPECRKDATKCYFGSTISEIHKNRFDACKAGNYGGCFGHFLENNFSFDY